MNTVVCVLACVLALFGLGNAFLARVPRRSKSSLLAAPPPPPPWSTNEGSDGYEKAASMTKKRQPIDSSSDSSLGEVVCVGDMLFDCIAQDSAKGWPIEKV